VALGPDQHAPYLDIARILEAARRTGADAIHPGYGFLSERAEFAEAVLDAGLTWVGPPPEVMAALGRKDAAKALARSLGVPVVPGFELARDALDPVAEAPMEPEESDDPQQRARATLDEARRRDEALARERQRSLTGDESWARGTASLADALHLADAIGFPVLIKAVAGGGGRGMRTVQRLEDLTEALHLAAREAREVFGDPALLVEKYIEQGRHVEVQILADAHGTVLAIGERECSIQRRHQKLIEESPSPGLPPGQRKALWESAVRLASGVAYVSAGTVEFLVDDQTGDFYFLEVNTRIQVEHPVTELVTGLDLVAWQLHIAAGRPLTLTPADALPKGHAIEARLCAEDPVRDFLPQSGPIVRWQPPVGTGVRVDHGLHASDHVGVRYDPMLAKIIAWGVDRATATARLTSALQATVLHGLVSNRQYLLDMLNEPGFAAGQTTTAFVAQHPPRPAPPAPDATLVAAALWLHARGLQRRFRNHPSRADVTVLHAGADLVHVALAFTAGSRFQWGISRAPDPLLWDVPPLAGEVTLVERAATAVVLELDGHRRRWEVTQAGDGLWLQDDAGIEVHLREGTLLPLPQPPVPTAGSVLAPGPALVSAVHVEPGQTVAADAPLVTLEAMKMLTVLRAPLASVVLAVLAAKGDAVAAGMALVELEEVL
jgi:acetyl/propionyl-CoA carboxylase alpha subunit